MTASTDVLCHRVGQPRAQIAPASPDNVGAAVVEFVYGGLAENPARVGRPLRWELEGLHAARRGDYRVVYRIDDTRHAVIVEAVVHRADIYRPS